jgi:hypothetical protein
MMFDVLDNFDLIHGVLESEYHKIFKEYYVHIMAFVNLAIFFFLVVRFFRKGSDFIQGYYFFIFDYYYGIFFFFPTLFFLYRNNLYIQKNVYIPYILNNHY